MKKYIKIIMLTAVCAVNAQILPPINQTGQINPNVVPIPVVGQECNYTSSLNVSTGYDPATNTVLAPSVIDPLWRLINLPPLSGPTPSAVQIGTAYVITRHSTGWCDNNLSPANTNPFPISANNVSGFSTNNQFSTQPFRFVREFCVSESGNINFNLRLKADDAARLSLIDANNNTIFCYATDSFDCTFSTQQNPNFNNAQWNGWLYNKPHFLSAGNYTLQIEVLNQGATAMGATLSGTVSSVNNQNILANDIGCCDVGTITVSKIKDDNCNGTFDEGETAMGDISFNLLDAGGSILQTAATDQFGEITFFNVPFGTYTVQEVVPLGYTPLGSSQQNVTLSGENGATQTRFLEFFNCPKISCCETDLAIWNVLGTPDPIPTAQQVQGGVPVTIASEDFEIHQNSTLPITELRVSITDIVFNYNYESCGKCESNPALWGSLLTATNSIEGLQFVSVPDNAGNPTVGNSENMVTAHTGVRELVWRNPNGVMLHAGTTFSTLYMLPPISEIPCCATSVDICIKISWKDANCNVCEVSSCSNINIVNENNNLGKINITKANDCCGATLSVNNSASNVQWSNGENTPSIHISEPGTYSVTVAGQTETIIVTSDDVGARYYTDLTQPSNQSFYSSSGNNNSYNSFYIMHVEDPQPPYGEYYATDYRLEVWDRWGEMIRAIEGTIENCQGFPNPAIFWDGMVNGNKVQEDVYNGKLFLKNCKYKNEWVPVKVNYCLEWGYTCLESECKVTFLAGPKCGFLKREVCKKLSGKMCKEEHKEIIFPITIV